MEGRSHMIFGGAFGVALGAMAHAPIATQVVMLAVGTFGGLLPDLDTQASTLGKRIPKWIHRLTPGHRGMTHSLLWCGFIFGLCYVVQLGGADWAHFWRQPATPWIPAGIAVGAFSHLVADSLTTRGVNYLYPWRHSFHPIGPLSFPTGTKREHTAVLLVCVLSASLVAYPLLEPSASGLVHSPRLWGLPTQPVLIFVLILIGVAVGTVIWSLYQVHKHPHKRKAGGCETHHAIVHAQKAQQKTGATRRPPGQPPTTPRRRPVRPSRTRRG